MELAIPPVERATPGSPRVEELLRHEQLRLAYDYLPASQLVAIINGILLVAVMVHALVRFRAHERIYRNLLAREQSQLYLPRANLVLHDLTRLMLARVHAANPAQARALDLELAGIRGRMRTELYGARAEWPSRSRDIDRFAVEFDRLLRLAAGIRDQAAAGRTNAAIEALIQQLDPAMQSQRAGLQALAEEVRRRVRETSGIELHWEIKRIGVPAPAAA